MEALLPGLIDKLSDYPVLLAFLYVMWNQHKVTVKMLDIIKGKDDSES